MKNAKIIASVFAIFLSNSAIAAETLVIKGTGTITRIYSQCYDGNGVECEIPDYYYKVGDEFQFSISTEYKFYWRGSSDNRYYNGSENFLLKKNINQISDYISYDTSTSISAPISYVGDVYRNTPLLKYGLLDYNVLIFDNGSDDPDFNNWSVVRTEGSNFIYGASEGTRHACIHVYHGGSECQDVYYEIYGSGRITDVIVNGIRTGTVPEPSSWMLLIAGFGFVGSRLRKAIADRDGQIPPSRVMRLPA